MEIIDCFCGIGPWQKRDRLLPYEPADILALMDHFGIASALVHSNFISGNGSVARGNSMVRDACERFDRFTPAMTLCPFPYAGQPTEEAQFHEMREAGAKALWHVPRQGLTSSHLYDKILSGCVQRRIPVLLHRDHASPDDVQRLCTDFPGLRLVLVGLGYREDLWLYPAMKQFEDLYVCLGHFYIPAHGPMRFLQHFPAERLLFGSGLPHFSPGGLIAHVMYADISDDDRQRILSGNIKRLMSEVRL